MTIKAVDLFCGVGGLTYGLQKAGIPVVAGIDIDDSCEYAYTHNNNCTFIHKSVEDVTGKEIRALLRGADVKILVGCAPCQPFSSHQKDKQNRSKHKDWKLLYQFGRLVEETRPHIVSMENVPELEKEKVFKDFVSTLEGLNYIDIPVSKTIFALPSTACAANVYALFRGKPCATAASAIASININT